MVFWPRGPLTALTTCLGTSRDASSALDSRRALLLSPAVRSCPSPLYSSRQSAASMVARRRMAAVSGISSRRALERRRISPRVTASSCARGGTGPRRAGRGPGGRGGVVLVEKFAASPPRLGGAPRQRRRPQPRRLRQRSTRSTRESPRRVPYAPPGPPRGPRAPAKSGRCSRWASGGAARSGGSGSCQREKPGRVEPSSPCWSSKAARASLWPASGEAGPGKRHPPGAERWAVTTCRVRKVSRRRRSR